MKTHRRAIIGAAALSLTAAMIPFGTAANPSAAAAVPVTSVSEDCATQPTTRVTGTLSGEFHDPAPPDSRTYDLRELTSIGSPFTTTTPFMFGEQRHSRYLCVRGGTVQGSTEMDDMLRDVVKQRWVGPGMSMAGANDHPSVVDGLRIDRSEDGFNPIGDGFVLRNAYLSNIHDDCVEADFLSAGLIEDSLFDGCFAGVSTDSPVRPSPMNPQPLVVDGVLMRVKPFLRTPTRLQAIRLFKSRPWSHIVLRDSVFLVDEWGNVPNSVGHFRGVVEAENVTVVWLGDGTFPGSVPDGVTVVTDLEVWEDAREAWLVRSSPRLRRGELAFWPVSWGLVFSGGSSCRHVWLRVLAGDSFAACFATSIW